MGFAPLAAIDGPDRQPLPYGAFSVVSLAEAATERWENGVTWEAFGCDPVGVVIGDCDPASAVGFPKQFPDGSGTGSATPFTVYGAAKCTPGAGDINKQRDKAREVLLAREQQGVETRLWMKMAADDNADLLTASSPLLGLGRLEKWIGDNYGSKGVIHASRLAATVLVKAAVLRPSGGQLLTQLGTPVIVGSGYPGTGRAISEVQTVTVTDGAAPSGTFTLSYDGQTTDPIAWNASAADVRAALDAIGAPVTDATGGVLGTNPVTVTFDTDGENVPQMTASGAGLTDASVATATTTEGDVTDPAAGSEFIAASPALFGYRSDVFMPSDGQGDLLDRNTNTLFGIAERNYLLGYDPCGVAFVEIDLDGTGV